MNPAEAPDILSWILRALALAALSAAGASWLVIRRWSQVSQQAAAAEAARDASRRELERRNRELEALNQVAAAIGRRGELSAAAEAILDAVLGLTRIGEGAVYRLDRATNTVALIAQRGYTRGEAALLDGRPAEQTMIGRAILEGRPLVASFADWPSPDPRLRALAQRHRAHSQLSLPIAVKGEAWGALALVSTDPVRLDAETVRLLEALAEQISVAAERAALLAETRENSRRLESLAVLAQSLTSTLSPQQVLDTVLEATRSFFAEGAVRLWLVDGESLALGAEAGVRDLEALPRLDRVAFGAGLAGHAALAREPAVAEDLLGDPRTIAPEWSRAQGFVAGAAFPFVARGHLWGVLSVFTRAPHRFTPEEVSGLQSFSHQAAVAMDNATLFQATTRRLEETRALLEVVEILNSTLEPRWLLRQVAIKVAQVCRVDRCTIERWDGGRVVPLTSQFADGRAAPELWRAFVTDMRAYEPQAIAAYVKATQSREPVVIDDLAGSDLIPRVWIERYSHRSCAIVPLVQQDQVIGGLILDYSERPTAFSSGQVDLARAIAGQLALALENSRLYAEAQQRLRESATLVKVGRALSQPGAPADVMREVARVVARAIGADMVGVYALAPTRDALVPVAGYRVPPHLLEALLRRRFVLARFTGVLDSWRAGRAIWSSDVHADPRFDRSTFEDIDPHAVLFAPTPVRGEPVGGLFLVWWGTGRQFPSEEVRLVEAVAAQIGLAMENAELGRQTQARLAETETLLAVSRTLASTLDLETMPRHFLRHIVQALGADTAGVWLLDETGQWLEPLAGYRVPKPTLEALRGVRIPITGNSFYAEAAQSLRCVVSTEGDRDPRLPPHLREALAHRMQLFVPIVANERMTGGFAVTWTAEARELSEGELRLVEAVATQAGAALDNARLFRDNQRRVEELSVLHELSRAVTGRLDQAGLIETIHQQVARILDVRHLVIVLHDEGSDELEVALRIVDGRSDPGEPRRYPTRAGGLLSPVIESGRPLRTADYVGECARRGLAPMPGSDAPPHWLAVPMTADGRILGALGLRARDRAFTERDERLLVNIADLAALALRSARLFEDRTRAYRELAAAQDQLVRSEKLRALGEMASGVAHDFNNMLAAIVGRAQLLLREIRDPRLRRWLEVIERSALDGAHTVRQLQEFTRIRRDQPFVAVDLNRVVGEALEATESRWLDEPLRRGIAIELRTELAPDLPTVSGDPAELREALTNLVINAVDAMPRGGVLSLETALAGEEIWLAVGDTGVGIPAEVRERIFDPFFTTKGPQGTGLGLSMTYGILLRHGARVTLQTEEGRGTTFVLHFPVTAPAAEAPAPVRPEEAPDPLRCLVVDDEAHVGDVMGDMLASLGHEPVVLRRGEDAVARFDPEAFDVVFTDLSMPGLSGWEVARAIRASSAATPVFLVTGFGVELPPDELGAQGVEAVLSKPLSLQDVIGALSGVRRRP